MEHGRALAWAGLAFSQLQKVDAVSKIFHYESHFAKVRLTLSLLFSSQLNSKVE
jgi:hypothetical protein